MSKRRLTIVLGLAASGALVAVMGSSASLSSTAARSVAITPCQNVVRKPPHNVWTCVGPYTLGIPASAPRVAFFVNTSGFWGPGPVTFNILDGKSRQPLINAATVTVPHAYKTGFLWWFALNGPFPKTTIIITTTVGGQMIGAGQIFRFV